MHITRIVTGISNGNETLVYGLNGFQVYINRVTDEVLVGIRAHSTLNVNDIELCELVEAIGLQDSGQHKINPNNKNMTDFLKVTKCI